MTNEFTSKIKKDGEKYVLDYLKSNSFTNVTLDIWQYGVSNIKADSWGEKILVHITTSIFPSEPDDISREDRGNIISRAASTKRSPYAAYVKVDGVNGLLESIRWEKLN